MAKDAKFDPKLTRRGFLKAGLAAGAVGGAAQAGAKTVVDAQSDPDFVVRPFYGFHQSGIVDSQQKHTYVAALDLTTADRAAVIALLRAWTDASARMTRGLTAKPLNTAVAKATPTGMVDTVTTSTESDYGASDAAAPDTSAPDSADVLGVGPSELTITFGFGLGLFEKGGKDRYGLAHRRPAALVELPRFNGDQLIPAQTGGDLLIQACSGDAQVAFHAVRQLARLAQGTAQMRWGQAGFLTGPRNATPRNLMGFKDGTSNPSNASPEQMDRFVWVGGADAEWMRGGTYTVVRRIRITLEHWDNMDLSFQEQVIGRSKLSGAPLGKQHEFDAIDLKKADTEGNPVIADNAHIRLSNEAVNNGAQILRRSYSYNDGTDFYVERWPPWRQETEYDAGLIFIAHQSDPRTGFIPINEKLARFDMLNQFTTHVGGGLFACPPGAKEGSYIGAALFSA